MKRHSRTCSISSSWSCGLVFSKRWLAVAIPARLTLVAIARETFQVGSGAVEGTGLGWIF